MGDINDYVDQSDIKDMSEEEIKVAEESFEVLEVGGRKGRGPDKEWLDNESFKDGTSHIEAQKT